MIRCVFLKQLTLEKGVEEEQDWWLPDHLGICSIPFFKNHVGLFWTNDHEMKRTEEIWVQFMR